MNQASIAMPMPKLPLLLLALLALLNLAPWSVAQDKETLQLASAPDSVRKPLLAKDWATAEKELDRLLERDDKADDYWLLLKAVAQRGAGKLEEAEVTLKSLERDQATSPWLFKSQFMRADIYRELHRYEEAVQVYEEAATRVRSGERQAELANIYFEFADGLSAKLDPSRPDSGGRDLARAALLYAKVLDLEAPRALRERATYRVGACLFELQRWNDASQQYERYLREFGGKEILATDRETDGRVLRARFELAQCDKQAGNWPSARRRFENLAADVRAYRTGAGGTLELASENEWAGVRSTELEELEARAMHAAAGTYQGSASERLLAVAALERLLEAVPAWPGAFQARFQIAEHYQAMGREEDALAAYGEFLASPNTSSTDSELRERDQELRRRSLFLRGEIMRGQRRYERAIATFSDYVARHSTGPDWASAQQAILECEYSLGQLHREEKRFEAARSSWTAFLESHPLDPRSRAILFDLGQLFAEEALATEAPEAAETRELWLAAIQAWRRVVAKYPGTNEASHALFNTGDAYERRLAQFDDAIAAYRSCNFGSHHSSAIARLNGMTEETLAVHTERTWRTDEKARVRLTTRNVEEVTIELYALDLEAYFRKHLTHRRIEDLDLDLISTDQELKESIEGYERYKLIQHDFELPVTGPGVWAVVVIAGEQRATTLVLQSDIDLIVKSSRTEVFAFAQDMRLGQPAQGVRVLIGAPSADGQQGVREMLTNEDGVARLAFPELEQADDMHVFAIREGHFAAHGISIQGLRVPVGLSARGVAYTDRSAYRPGQQVNWRAILREVDGGSFSFTEGSEYRIELLDSQGRLLDRKRAPLGRFGTLSGQFVLDEYAPFGTYTLRCSRDNSVSAACNFLVEEYQLQKVDLTFDLKRAVYFRGETVEVGIDARYYYGAPVANSPVQYVLPDGRTGETVTDMEGHATLSFETRDFANEGALHFRATLPNEQISRADSVQLAIRGYRATIETGRDVYLAGSSFGIDVAAFTPDAKPASRELVLTVLRLEPGPFGSTSQVEVERRTVTTDEETGEGSLSVRVAKGGTYQLRVEGIDRFKNPVTATKQIYVSGDEDTVNLRFLSDAKKWKVGEPASLELHSRSANGLALITFEGESILGYRIVQLTTGSNALDFLVDHEHFPNFAVTAAMMQENKFHSAEIQFDVSRKLNVTVETNSESYAPGEAAAATVRVTDQLGRPVSAEVSLAVVDAALFDLYPDNTPALASVFDAGMRREARMRTVSSCEFSYQGVTRRISQAILDDQELQLREKEWEEAKLGVSSRLARARAGAAAPASEEDLDYKREFSADSPFDSSTFNDMIALGGGAGGKMGGRFGGKKLKREFDVAANPDASDSSGLRADTAFWSATLITDESGEAKVEFRVPERSTRWRMTARGVGRDTLLGEFEASMISKSEFFVELRSPVGLTEGDQPQFIARVHNLTGKQGQCSVILKLKTPETGAMRELSRNVVLGDRPVVEVLFDATAALPSSEAFTVTTEASFEGRQVRDTQELRVRPWGIEQIVSRSGLLDSRTVLDLMLPGGTTYTDRSLELFVGAGLDHLVIEAALGRTGIYQPRGGTSRISTQADAASDLAGVCAALEFITKSDAAKHPAYRELHSRAEGLVARLVGAQNNDGGWGWIGRNTGSTVETSSRAMVALARAKAIGLTLDASIISKGLQYLDSGFRAAAQDADESKSMLLYALAANGQSDFGAANRLHRNRHTLSPAALAYTTLALVEMNRGPMAVDVAMVLQEKAVFSDGVPKTCRWPTTDNTSWNQSSLDSAAVAILALQRALPSSPAIDAGVEYLLASLPWKSRGSVGAIVEALVVFAGKTQPQRDNLRVTVTIDGKARVIQLSPASPGESMRILLPKEHPAPVKVELALEGRGRPHFSAVLRGFDSGMRSLESNDSDFISSEFRYMAVPPRFNGQAISTGFNVVRNEKNQWINEVKNLPASERTRVRIRFYGRHRDNSLNRYDYPVIEIPIPAGTRVLEDTLVGNYQSFEVRDGLLTIYSASYYGSETYEFELLGANPGKYRVLPARVSSALDPVRYSYLPATGLTVLPAGAESPDRYKPTPNELYYLGQAHYEAGSFDEAHALLGSLFAQYETTLYPDKLNYTANCMLHMSIERGEANAIVRYFEVLKEKDPSITIAFDKILKVADAYRELGEFERALLIYRAVVEETHGKDLKVAGTLREQDEFAGATDTLERLWLEYPDFPASLQAQLALTDLILKKAPEAARDKSLRKAGRNRASLTTQGILMLKRFLSMYPESPLAPEAGLNLVSAYLGLEDYETTQQLAGEMATLYEEPQFADAFLYTRAVAQWYLGNNDTARELLLRIAEANYATEDGGHKPSENRELALYILGQIYHAQRDLDHAAEYYKRVAELFVDAKETLAGFNEKTLSVEEITTARPGQPVAFNLEFKNLQEVELLVYSVDLMTLYLREQNLSNITQVNLAGISPTLRSVVALEEGTDLRTAEQSVDLQLNEAGAYLVICRGGDLFSSGLVLVSNLELEVKEDPSTGRLRVQVLDLETGGYLRDVDVRVVGSHDGAFQSGKTDPRGIFVADNVRGNATVIARLGGRQFAFHRGNQSLGAQEERALGEALGQTDFGSAAGQQGGYLGNVYKLNDDNFRAQQSQLDNEINKSRAGVQVLQVK